MTTLMVVLLIGAIVCYALAIYHYKTTKSEFGTLQEIRDETQSAMAALVDYRNEQRELSNQIENKVEQVNELVYQINTLKNAERQAALQATHATEMAEKEFEVERARRRTEFEQQLADELSNLERQSPKIALESELRTINVQIEEARRTLLIQQAQQRDEQEKEDFNEFHSIKLSPTDLKDIELIREFEPRLTRQEAFRKLVWTEFIQKPIQALCKILEAEKVRGIYKITNIKNGRMYIGQAVDVAARWKDHCKTALGIGSNSYLTNKFYKAMHDEGIENFTFEILEAGDINLSEREAYWVDFYNAVQFGYNSKAGG